MCRDSGCHSLTQLASAMRGRGSAIAKSALLTPSELPSSLWLAVCLADLSAAPAVDFKQPFSSSLAGSFGRSDSLRWLSDGDDEDVREENASGSFWMYCDMYNDLSNLVTTVKNESLAPRTRG